MLSLHGRQANSCIGDSLTQSMKSGVHFYPLGIKQSISCCCQLLKHHATRHRPHRNAPRPVNENRSAEPEPLSSLINLELEHKHKHPCIFTHTHTNKKKKKNPSQNQFCILFQLDLFVGKTPNVYICNSINISE